MPHFVAEMPHTEEQCAAALGELAEDVPELFDSIHWGCHHGVHDGWAIVEADSASEIREMISPVLRDQAVIIEVEHIPSERMREMHRQAA